jgi:hypothetical protein
MATHASPAYLLSLLQRQVLPAPRQSSTAAQLGRDDLTPYDRDGSFHFIGARRVAPVAAIGRA